MAKLIDSQIKELIIKVKEDKTEKEVLEEIIELEEEQLDMKQRRNKKQLKKIIDDYFKKEVCDK